MIIENYIDSYTLLDVGLLFFMLIAAVAIARTHSLLLATIMLSIYSLLMSIMYLTLGAPDVAITEAAIGGGISTVLLLSALLLTGQEEKPYKHPLLPLITVAAVGVVLVYATLDLPAFGDPHAITNNHLVPYYLANAMSETNVPNVVTAVLASYRGFDTLGEVFVVFTAGISVLLLLGKKKSNLS